VGMQNGAVNSIARWLRSFFYKLNIGLKYNPAITLLGIYPIELKI
jgi:hypothetical protein